MTEMHSKRQNEIAVHNSMCCFIAPVMKMSLITQQLGQFYRHRTCTHLRMDLGSAGELILLLTTLSWAQSLCCLQLVHRVLLFTKTNCMRMYGNNSAGSMGLETVVIPTRIIWRHKKNEQLYYYEAKRKEKLYCLSSGSDWELGN